MARKTKEHSAARTGTEANPSSPAHQHNGSVPLNPEKLKRLYSTMLKCRMIGEKVAELSKQGKMSESCHPGIGQEATAVGTLIDLLYGDYVAGAERDFIPSFIKGTPLKLIFSRLRSQQASMDQKRSPAARNGAASLKIVSPGSSCGGHLDIAAGVALAYKMQKRSLVTVAFCGDGAAALDPWHQAMRLAGAQKLPIVFVIENSSPAAAAGIDAQDADGDLSTRAAAYGFAGITVDGDDVVAVYRVAQESIRRAREGHGSALIECKTCRQPERSKPAGHGSLKRAEYWKSRDPILFMENYLKHKDLWSDEWEQNLVQDFRKELEEAAVLVEPSPHPEPARRREHVHSFKVFDGELNRKMLEFRGTAPNPAKLGKP